jgi:hypothetical protein
MIRTWQSRALCPTCVWGKDRRKSSAASAIAREATGLEHKRSEASIEMVRGGDAWAHFAEKNNDRQTRRIIQATTENRSANAGGTIISHCQLRGTGLQTIATRL